MVQPRVCFGHLVHCARAQKHHLVPQSKVNKRLQNLKSVAACAGYTEPDIF